MAVTLAEALVVIAGENQKLKDTLHDSERQTQTSVSRIGHIIDTTIGVALGNLATKAAGAIAGAFTRMAGTITDSVRSFADFEGQMREVFTLLPDIAEPAMQEMSDQVRVFAKEFGILPDKLIPALYDAISAGVPQDTVFEFLATAAKASVGGVTELGTAVDGIRSVVNAYGAEVLSAAEASDQMFTAVRLGKTNFEQLSRFLFQVVPVAAGLGLEFGNVTAAIAALTAQGTPTSVASTQIRQALVELSKEGGKTADLFKRLAGVTFREFIAQGGNLQQALQLLERQAAALGVGVSDLFSSVEAGNAALSLTGRGTAAFTNALDAMANATGATEGAFARMDSGLRRSFARIRAGANDMLIEIGERMSPAVQEFADSVLGVLPGITDGLSTIMSTLGQAAAMMGVEFAKMAGNAGDWGQNISIQLANGIAAALPYVLGAVRAIGELIGYWLAPGSPPRLLPDLPDWGKSAMQEFLDGFGKADFRTLEDFSQTIRDLLSVKVKSGEIDEGDLAPALIGARGGLAEALAELRQTGDVSEDVFARIRAAAGAAGEEVEAFARAYIDTRRLEAAQAQYSAVSDEYRDKLVAARKRGASKAEIDAIRAERSERLKVERAKVDEARKADATARETLDLAKGRLDAIVDERRIYDDHTRTIGEFSRALGGVGGVAAVVRPAVDALAQAQLQLRLAMADTAGKIEILRGEQAKYEEGSLEWIRLETQIVGLQQQLQRELKGTGGALATVSDALADYRAALDAARGGEPFDPIRDLFGPEGPLDKAKINIADLFDWESINAKADEVAASIVATFRGDDGKISWASIGTSIGEPLGEAIVEGVIAAAKTLPGRLVAAAKAGLTELQNEVNKLYEQVAIGGPQPAAKNPIDLLLKPIRGAGNAATAWADGKPIGEALIDGVVGGIREKASAVDTWLVNTLNAATATLKNALQMRSPSAVYQEIGSGMMQGLILGAVNLLAQVVVALTAPTKAAQADLATRPPEFGKVAGDMMAAMRQAADDAYKSLFEAIVKPWNDALAYIEDLLENWPGVPPPPTGDGSGGTPPGNAAGTAWWRGGLTMVGERGPELVSLPRGSEILSAGQTRAALAGVGSNVTISFGDVHVRDEADIHILARRIAAEINRRSR